MTPGNRVPVTTISNLTIGDVLKYTYSIDGALWGIYIGNNHIWRHCDGTPYPVNLTIHNRWWILDHINLELKESITPKTRFSILR